MTRLRLAVLITACVALLAACTTGDDSPASLPTPEPANVSSPMNEGGEPTVGTPESAGTDAQDPADEDDLEATPAPRAEPVNESDAPAVDASAPPTAPAASRFEPVTLVRVVDGDTIVVRLGSGQEERVRYIGIDTPETVAPGTPVQPFGPEASARNAELVEGRELFLEADVSERDRFDRLLRYVWVQDVATGDLVMVNEVLVAEGLASVSTFPPDVKYLDRLRAAEAEARGMGIWVNASRPPSDVAAAGGCDDAYPGVCIPRPPPDLDCGEVPFRRFAVVGSDPHRFDGDKDGISCESG